MLEEIKIIATKELELDNLDQERKRKEIPQSEEVEEVFVKVIYEFSLSNDD